MPNHKMKYRMKIVFETRASNKESFFFFHVRLEIEVKNRSIKVNISIKCILKKRSSCIQTELTHTSTTLRFFFLTI